MKEETGEAGARTEGETKSNQEFSKTSLRNQHLTRPTMTTSYSAFSGLSRKGVSSRFNSVWAAWGTGAGRTGQGERDGRESGVQTLRGRGILCFILSCKPLKVLSRELI